MMKIFVLEDNPDRIKYFALRFIKDELVISNNSKYGLNIVKNNKFDYIFLNHDLGDEVYVSTEHENCGIIFVNI